MIQLSSIPREHWNLIHALLVPGQTSFLRTQWVGHQNLFKFSAISDASRISDHRYQGKGRNRCIERTRGLIEVDPFNTFLDDHNFAFWGPVLIANLAKLDPNFTQDRIVLNDPKFKPKIRWNGNPTSYIDVRYSDGRRFAVGATIIPQVNPELFCGKVIETGSFHNPFPMEP